ncbi:ergothioneine biosynthesis protein EgtB [Luteibaculum oceani]|uniref:Ergothioneine biosynthesis protein EgtB n=1 Tax=Luteibaculum oceani TaxID=1294296 RepID=A0A5C6VB60_9FLAO|nr:ergothioneine biosynthesis protein EgtB [Luteibaculum oceani]TXC82134.1 ergothioneine biosynthesis protein EgtB [Luteibaculum oceani]
MDSVTVADNTEIIRRFKKVRARTEELCSPLGVEDFIPQPAVFVSPAKWHIAHTTWFFEEFVLSKFKKGYTRFHKDFAFLFNSYYNSVGERLERDNRGLLTRPRLELVFDYRKSVDQEIVSLLQNTDRQELINTIELGLQHEQQHQELLITDLKYIFSQNPIYPTYHKDYYWEKIVEPSQPDVLIEEGVYNIGYEGKDFSFDNEHGKHKVYINPVEISGNLVSNQEFIEFIESGGYDKSEFWLDEGWAFIQENSCKLPLYWKKEDGNYFQYTLNGLQEVNPKAVLMHINYFEAVAYANYKGHRLCTEFEWEVASEELNWGTVWEWTQSAYLPYPNYKKPAGAIGEYNGKFMVNQMVLRGASVATAKGHSRNTYRNFFHPQYSWQVAGIRLAKEI